MILVVALVLTLAVAIPNFMKARVTTSMNTCVFRQMWLESAKMKWVESGRAGRGVEPTLQELARVAREVVPMWDGRSASVGWEVTTNSFDCLLGGRIDVGSKDRPVSCSEGLHRWTREDFEYHYGRGR